MLQIAAAGKAVGHTRDIITDLAGALFGVCWRAAADLGEGLVVFHIEVKQSTNDTGDLE